MLVLKLVVAIQEAVTTETHQSLSTLFQDFLTNSMNNLPGHDL